MVVVGELRYMDSWLKSMLMLRKLARKWLLWISCLPFHTVGEKQNHHFSKLCQCFLFRFAKGGNSPPWISKRQKISKLRGGIGNLSHFPQFSTFDIIKEISLGKPYNFHFSHHWFLNLVSSSMTSTTQYSTNNVPSGTCNSTKRSLRCFFLDSRTSNKFTICYMLTLLYIRR